MRRLQIVFVGEVDHGKSTLIGRLLLDTGSLSRRREEEARSGAVPLAHLVDQLGREQDEGLTVTNAEAIMRLPDGDRVLVDAPGHEEFLRNMLSGTSGAYGAVIVVDAREGVRPETRRHALLVRLLRIPQAIAVVNKIDAAGDAIAAFAIASDDIRRVAAEVGLALAAVIPASAARGTQVTPAGERLSWFEGPTVLGALRAFEAPGFEAGPVRFSVQDRYDFLPERPVAGRVERGTLRRGATLEALPGGGAVTVRHILAFPGGELDALEAGLAGTIVVDRPEAVRRGHVLAPAGDLPPARRVLRGRTFCLAAGGLSSGDRLLLRCATQETEAVVRAIDERLDSGRLAERPPGDRMDPLDLALVTFELECAIVTEDPQRSPALGRFVLEDGESTAACGMFEA